MGTRFDVEFTLACEDLLKVDDVNMLQCFHNSDLTTDVEGHFLCFNIALVHDLNGDLFAGFFMNVMLDSIVTN